ncbi:hypothetical protein, partial [Pseudofulvimonas gallinarii]
ICTTHRTPSLYLSAVSQIEGGKASAGAGEKQKAARDATSQLAGQFDPAAYRFPLNAKMNAQNVT